LKTNRNSIRKRGSAVWIVGNFEVLLQVYHKTPVRKKAYQLAYFQSVSIDQFFTQNVLCWLWQFDKR